MYAWQRYSLCRLALVYEQHLGSVYNFAHIFNQVKLQFVVVILHVTCPLHTSTSTCKSRSKGSSRRTKECKRSASTTPSSEKSNNGRHSGRCHKDSCKAGLEEKKDAIDLQFAGWLIVWNTTLFGWRCEFFLEIGKSYAGNFLCILIRRLQKSRFGRSRTWWAWTSRRKELRGWMFNCWSCKFTYCCNKWKGGQPPYSWNHPQPSGKVCRPYSLLARTELRSTQHESMTWDLGNATS